MTPTSIPGSGKGIDFGLIFFSSSETPFDGEKYQLVIESTRFADQHGFSSVWIPERHFTKDGWLYPNPAVLQAALARETSQIALRAGSVVVPLHNPLRVAEEWAMVDNLSGGRVGLSVASGWHPNDFALAPENYANRNEVMYSNIETIRKLWRGEAVTVKSGDGSMVELRTYPTPIQKELPIWVTAAGNPKTFAGAGKLGAHVLTHMYNHNIDELAEKIRIYRDARAEHGFDPATGQVSVMLHTFIGSDQQSVREQIQGPFSEYLKSASYLVNAIAYSRGQNVDLNSLSQQDLQDYLVFVMDRLIQQHRVLFGTPESCMEQVALLKAAGVNEIACQIDFGVDFAVVMQHMPYLNELRVRCNTADLTAYQTASSASHLSASQGATIEVVAKEATPVPADDSKNRIVDNTLNAIRQRCQQQVSLTHFYERVRASGVELGERFQRIEKLWRREREALGSISLAESLLAEASSYQVHPTLLDSSFQVLIAALPSDLYESASAHYLPAGIQSFQLFQKPGTRLWSHAVLQGSATLDSDVIEGTVRILNEDGSLVAEAQGIRLQRMLPLSGTTATTALTSDKTAPTSHDLDNLLYALQWEAQSLPTDQRETASGHWLIFTDGQGVGTALAQQLIQRGDSYSSIAQGDFYQVIASDGYRVAPDNASDIRKAVLAVQATVQKPLRGVIHLWSLDATPAATTTVATLEADQIRGTGSALSVIQSLIELSTNAEHQPRLWLVTRGAQPVARVDKQMPLAVAQSPLWGLGKTCAMEHPELWGGLVDLDPAATVQTAATQLLTVLLSSSGEDQVAFRAEQSYVARMVRHALQTPRPLVINPEGSYLITGGLWGLGLEVARWLAEKGARHLILLGRTPLPERAVWDRVDPTSRSAQQIAGIRAIEQTGAQVHYATVDVADKRQVYQFLETFARQGYPPIRGVMHAASVWQDAQGQSLVRPLANLSSSDLFTVFRPKVLGSWLLHTLLQGQPLDFFVSFSSGASLFGSAAQGNYAAAGEFLDVLAHYQRLQGQPALSIDWGAVSEIGFGGTAEGQRVHEYWESHGIQRITPRQVLAALELLIPQSTARVGVLKLDWPLLQQFFTQITDLPLVRHFVSPSIQMTGAEADTSTGQLTILQTLQNTPTEKRLAAVEDYLRGHVAGVLRVPDQRLDMAQPLTTLGLDSLMAIELKNKLEVELQVRIPIVTFLQGPSIEQFAQKVLDQLPVKVDTITEVDTVSVSNRPSAGTFTFDGQSIQDQSAVLTSNTSTSQVETQIQLPEVEPDLLQQNADQLLAQLDQLSDQDVEALLGQMLVEVDTSPAEEQKSGAGNGHDTETTGNGHSHHVNNGHNKNNGYAGTGNGHALSPSLAKNVLNADDLLNNLATLSAQEAEQLLAQLDQLSDAEVEALLSQFVEHDGEN